MTDVPLKEHIESRLDALEKASEEARRVLEKRLEGMNEFREQLKDQAATFIARMEYTANNEKFRLMIDDLKKYQSTMEGKASQSTAIFSIILALSGLIISFIGMIMLLSR
jgi:hypothetical protein